MVRYWLLSADDIRRINERRREHNRLGFAVQLCLLRYPGWPLRAGEKPPSNLLEFVAQQIDADPDEFGDYAAPEQTRQEEHIILTGTYHWKGRQTPWGRFRPLRPDVVERYGAMGA